MHFTLTASFKRVASNRCNQDCCLVPRYRSLGERISGITASPTSWRATTTTCILERASQGRDGAKQLFHSHFPCPPLLLQWECFPRMAGQLRTLACYPWSNKPMRNHHTGTCTTQVIRHHLPRHSQTGQYFTHFHTNIISKVKPVADAPVTPDPFCHHIMLGSLH